MTAPRGRHEVRLTVALNAHEVDRSAYALAADYDTRPGDDPRMALAAYQAIMGRMVQQMEDAVRTHLGLPSAAEDAQEAQEARRRRVATMRAAQYPPILNYPEKKENPNP